MMAPQNGSKKTHQEEFGERRKSIWDQFCDFTSLVGFRLLHSKHPLWLRLVSTGLMVMSTALICLQTRYFWTKFVESKGQRIATVKENENQALQQPRFLICVTQQDASLLRGHGSVDFRTLVYRHQLEGKRQSALIEQLETEMAKLDVFFNELQPMMDDSSNNNDETVRSAGITLAKELRLLRQIGAALSFDDSENFASFFQPSLNSTDNNEQKTEDLLAAERRAYNAQRTRVDKCLAQFVRDTAGGREGAEGTQHPMAGEDQQDLHQAFFQCRLQLARQLHAEFSAQQRDFFSYVHATWMRPEELIVKSHFFGDGPGQWASSWQVDNGGPCALGGPGKRRSIGLGAIAAEENNFDYILVKANQLEAAPGARINVYLVYEMEEHQQLVRANSFQLMAGKNLEITVRGISEILEDDCAAKYPAGCVPNNFVYSAHVCKWCAPETRKACPCANPGMYLAEFVGAHNLRNCTLLEAMQCGPRQAQLYTETDCPNACTSVEYTADYAAYDLSLEMLNMTVGEAEQNFVSEQLLLIDQFNQFKWPLGVGNGQKGSKIWKASERLDHFLADYYAMMIRVFRILYGSSFSLPTLFAEDLVGFLSETPPAGGSFDSLLQLAELQEERLELCAGASSKQKNEEEVLPIKQALKKIAQIYLQGNFRKLSFRIWNPCPVSISNENCRRLVNGTGQFQSDDILASLQQMIKSWSSSYRQCTLELSLMLNSTPPNPICIVQFYSQAEENLETLNNTLIELRNATAELLALLSAQTLPDHKCYQQKLALVQQLLNTSVLLAPPEGKWDNAWMDGFHTFLQENTGMRMISDFLTANMALITFHYRGLTFQHIVYHDDYTLWELMSDVGGVLGLYFGLTLVAIYELAVFATLVEREPAEVHRPAPERLFTRRLLYKRDPTLLTGTDRAVPIVFQ